jgi:hypothetical protein
MFFVQIVPRDFHVLDRRRAVFVDRIHIRLALAIRLELV